MNPTKSIILFSLALASFTSCNHEAGTEKNSTATALPDLITLTNRQLINAGVATGIIEMRTVAEVLKLNGKIDVPPQNLVSVSMPLGGYLKSTGLLPGLLVKKGDVLAVMEDQQYIQLQQDYLTAKAQFGFIESEYARQKELNESKANSDKVYEQTKANFQSQQILVRSLEQKLKLIGIQPETLTPNNISRTINLLSPVNGFVAAIHVNIGKYVNPSDVLFELVDPDDIHLILTVYDKDVEKLSVGQKVYAYTNNNPKIKHPCEIILISKNIGNSNTAEVHCHFLKYDKSRIPGTFMNALVEVTGSNVPSLPEEAIVRHENKYYIFVKKQSGSFQMVQVQPGNTENGYTELKNAIPVPTDSVAVKGAYNLLMALKNKTDE